MALALDLNVGTPRPFTTSGVPAPDGVLKTENGRFLITENGNFMYQWTTVPVYKTPSIVTKCMLLKLSPNG